MTPRISGQSRVIVVAVTLGLLSITGCAAAGSKPPFIAQVETGPQDQILLVNPFPKGRTEMQAGIVGVLTVDPSNCVVALDQDGNRWSVLLPQGTTFETGDPLSLNVAGTVLPIGSLATFGGGMVEGERNDTLIRDVPDQCKSDETFQIQNIELSP